MAIENVLSTYNGISFTLKNGGSPVICYNMDDLEDIMLSDINQPQNDKCFMILLV